MEAVPFYRNTVYFVSGHFVLVMHIKKMPPKQKTPPVSKRAKKIREMLKTRESDYRYYVQMGLPGMASPENYRRSTAVYKRHLQSLPDEKLFSIQKR